VLGEAQYYTFYISILEFQYKKTIGVGPSGGVPVDVGGHVVLPGGHRLQLVHVVELQLPVDVLQPGQNDELALQSAKVMLVSVYSYIHRRFQTLGQIRQETQPCTQALLEP
jgi:hypothetical protein